MKTNHNEIYVHIALDNDNILMGKLWYHYRKGRESASFEYHKNWLYHPEKFFLEPALQLTEGTFHTTPGQHIFGSIGDSAPDRWGRVLMRRAETNRAHKINESPRSLREIDYLLGVNDEIRQGALRFSTKEHGPFLNPNTKNAIPPLVDLPKLLSATENVLAHNDNAHDLKLLLAPGSSLGGARPKACVKDHDGYLAIAKFPRKDDEFNTVIWEAVALTLAKKAGINIPLWRLERINEKPVLLSRRFDRDKDTHIPYYLTIYTYPYSLRKCRLEEAKPARGNQPRPFCYCRGFNLSHRANLFQWFITIAKTTESS